MAYKPVSSVLENVSLNTAHFLRHIYHTNMIFGSFLGCPDPNIVVITLFFRWQQGVGFLNIDKNIRRGFPLTENALVFLENFPHDASCSGVVNLWFTA